MDLAVVGAGRWGQNYLRVLGEVPDCQVKWCIDLDPRRLKVLGVRYPTISFSSRLEDVLADPGVEAVVVATPPATHFPTALACLEHGKHVLVEKPCARTTAEILRLQEAAASRQKVFMAGHVMEYNPALQWLKNYLQEGRLGNLLYLYLTRTGLGVVRQDVNVLWDLAVHDLTILRLLVGAEPEAISAQGACYLQPGIHDLVFVTLKFPGNVMAQIHATWLAPRKIRQVTVVGDRQMAIFDDVAGEDKIRVYDRGVSSLCEPGGAAEGGYAMVPRYGDIYLPAITVQEPLANQCRHFVDCIREGKEPLTGWQDALWVTAALEAAQRSLESQGLRHTPALALPARLTSG